VAFTDLAKNVDVEQGASDRYKLLTALESMLDGSFYDKIKTLQHKFEEEFDGSGDYVPMRDRRPSLKYNLAHLLFSQTQGELFGDEMFPVVQCFKGKEREPDAEKAIGDLLELLDFDILMPQIFEEGQPGSCAVILRTTAAEMPYYDIQPGKFCEPVYLPADPLTMAVLKITYPIGKEQLMELYTEEEIRARDIDVDQTYWFRITIDAHEEKTYHALRADDFSRLGEKRSDDSVIAFEQRKAVPHKHGCVPAVFVKNLIGKQKCLDGPAMWWPIVDICIGADYELSQEDRGLRYAADPMLFLKQGDLFNQAQSLPAGDEANGEAAVRDGDGSIVRGPTQILRGEDAKLIEMEASGMAELREFVAQLREWALEVVGGMKSDAANEKAAQSGAALQQLRKPLMLLVSRQRKAYGKGCLLPLVSLTVDALRKGICRVDGFEVDSIPEGARFKLDWPSDEQLLGQDLLYTVQGLQLAAGGTVMAPLELIPGDAVAKKLAGELGLTDPAQVNENPKPLPQPEPTPTGGGAKE
jgi:hypothetical protein